MLWVNNIDIGVMFCNYGFKFENPNLMGSINLWVFKWLKSRSLNYVNKLVIVVKRLMNIILELMILRKC